MVSVRPNTITQSISDQYVIVLYLLSHQGRVLAESSRSPWKMQNAEVHAVRSPRAQKHLRGISIGRRGVS